MALPKSLDPPLPLAEVEFILADENLLVEELGRLLTHTKDPARRALIADAIFKAKGRLARKVRELEQALEQARHRQRLAEEFLQRITQSEDDEPDPPSPSIP